MKLKAIGSGDPPAVHPSQRGSCAAPRSEAALQGELCQPQTKALLCATGSFLQGQSGAARPINSQSRAPPRPSPHQVRSAAGPSAPQHGHGAPRQP